MTNAVRQPGASPHDSTSAAEALRKALKPGTAGGIDAPKARNSHRPADAGSPQVYGSLPVPVVRPGATPVPAQQSLRTRRCREPALPAVLMQVGQRINGQEAVSSVRCVAPARSIAPPGRRRCSSTTGVPGLLPSLRKTTNRASGPIAVVGSRRPGEAVVHFFIFIEFQRHRGRPRQRRRAVRVPGQSLSGVRPPRSGQLYGNAGPSLRARQQ